MVEDREINWSTMVGYDGVIIQRPHERSHLQAVKIAVDLGIPVVVDYDDYLSGLPRDNPSYRYYDGCDETIQEILSLADRVVVSTDWLAGRYGGEVVRNELPVNWRTGVLGHSSDKIRIVWRGSRTHEGDWLACLSEACEVSREYRNQIEWIFVGAPPFFVLERMRKIVPCHLVDELPIDRYWNFMFRRDEALGEIIYVPLADSVFNQCKSNIAEIEGVYAGCLPAVPGWHDEFLSGFDLRSAIDLWLESPVRAVDEIEKLKGRFSFGAAEKRKGILEGLWR
jgi:hypothetical protein